MSDSLSPAAHPKRSDYCTVKEAAEIWRTTVNSIYVARSKRKSHIPEAYRFGKKLLFKRADVLAALRPADHDI